MLVQPLGRAAPPPAARPGPDLGAATSPETQAMGNCVKRVDTHRTKKNWCP